MGTLESYLRLTLTALMACAFTNHSVALEYDPSDVTQTAMEAGIPLYAVYGHGFSDNGLFTFDFNIQAEQLSDGSASGLVSLVVDYPDANYFPELVVLVFCMEVDEATNEVWLSGPVVQSNLLDVFPLGSPAAIWVEDGGMGGEDYFGGDAAVDYMACVDRPGVPNEELVIEGDFKLTPTLEDSDGDGVLDDSDNCRFIQNPAQRDSDGDGHGNRCDGDLNNDCITNSPDLGILRSVFFSADPDADFNGDGVVNVVDLGIFRAMFFLAPGPSPSGGLCN